MASDSKSGNLSVELSADFLSKTLAIDLPIEQMIELLLEKGIEIVAKCDKKIYDSYKTFLTDQKEEVSPLVELEGSSDVVGEGVVIVKNCPMAPVMAELKIADKLPDHFTEIVTKYIEDNPRNAGILHPGCIVHQFIRQQLIAGIQIGEKYPLNYVQLGCRSTATGKQVYSEMGIERLGVSIDKIKEWLEGQACLYAIIPPEDD
ncbi:MAG: hypothetical protein ACFFD4_35770 [Candidatus Odinarchaeota archaeon]